MTSWVRVETRFVSHPKVLEIGPLGEALWLRGLCYAGEQLTDGFVPSTYVKRMGDMKGSVVAYRLVEAGLWTEEEGGYRIHDYLEWQRSRDEAADVSSKRAESGRRGGKQRAINLLANDKQVDKQNPSKQCSKTLADKIREETEVETKDPLNPPEGDEPNPLSKKPDKLENFPALWDAFPRHDKRLQAERAWVALTESERQECLERFPVLNAEYRQREKQFVPQLSTFLNGRRWRDDVIATNGHGPPTKPVTQRDNIMSESEWNATGGGGWKEEAERQKVKQEREFDAMPEGPAKQKIRDTIDGIKAGRKAYQEGLGSAAS